jgi:hypothetical protein
LLKQQLLKGHFLLHHHRIDALFKLIVVLTFDLTGDLELAGDLDQNDDFD